MNIYSIVLSAGKGTRMQSDGPKVIQKILDKPMVNIVLKELETLGIKENYLVVGYQKEKVVEAVDEEFSNICYEEQKEQKGTGHAVAMLKEKMQDLIGVTIICYGDTPLVTEEIFSELLEYHLNQENDLTILSTEVDNPFGYGRILRDDKLKVLKIVEQKDATDSQREIKEINSGIYCINNELLFKYIGDINNNNSQNEYYLTDIIAIFKKNNLKVDAYKTPYSDYLIGVNSLVELAKASEIMKRRINYKHLENGVNILDPNNTYIGLDVKIGSGTIIYPNNHLLGKVTIGTSNILKPSNYIENVTIGNNNEIGPMCHMRLNSTISNNSRVGNFVEIKNSKLADGVKSAHLTYLGDSDIGEATNIGCGVITANYDGKNKYKTKIGNNSFIGSNVNIIAPLELGSGVFIAAGTTVTKDIPKDKFVIGRTREVIKDKR